MGPQGWLRLADGSGWVLCDGRRLGLPAELLRAAEPTGDGAAASAAQTGSRAADDGRPPVNGEGGGAKMRDEDAAAAAALRVREEAEEARAAQERRDDDEAAAEERRRGGGSGLDLEYLAAGCAGAQGLMQHACVAAIMACHCTGE
eukprot:5558405-Prymnesium_polylepis.1